MWRPQLGFNASGLAGPVRNREGHQRLRNARGKLDKWRYWLPLLVAQMAAEKAAQRSQRIG
jgi:hypothetical protein